jgi:hypothetical protein
MAPKRQNPKIEKRESVFKKENKVDGSESVTTKLQVSAIDKKVLTKNQQMFNKLTQQIEKLENDIVKETKFLDTLSDIYRKEILSLECEIAQHKIRLAMALDDASTRFKFSKSQVKDIKGTITSLFDDAFRTVEPTPEQEAVYDRWAELSYKDEVQRQKDEEMNMFNEVFSEFFGKNVEDFDGNPEDFEKFQQEFFSHHKEEKKSFQNKTKKQLEKEAAKKIEEELKTKSVRSIYISLAKVLHPDAETDPDLRHEKEQVMKQVTVAYEEKDLQMLLKLEIEWVHKTTAHLDELSDEKLKMYISVLKEQVDQLKKEKYQLVRKPQYSVIQHISHLTEKQSLKEVYRAKTVLKDVLLMSVEIELMVKKAQSKNSIVKITKEYINSKTMMEEFDEMYDEFGFSYDDFMFR